MQVGSARDNTIPAECTACPSAFFVQIIDEITTQLEHLSEALEVSKLKC